MPRLTPSLLQRHNLRLPQRIPQPPCHRRLIPSIYGSSITPHSSFTPSISSISKTTDPARLDNEYSDLMQPSIDFRSSHLSTPSYDHHESYHESPNAPTGTHNSFTALQWNCQGLSTALCSLLMDIRNHDFPIIMLQEPYVPYRHSTTWVPIPIANYIDYHCQFHKTSIYVRSGINHYAIPLKPILHGRSRKNILHTTAIIIRMQLYSRTRNILFLNCYRSPNGDAPALDYQKYVRQCKKYQHENLPHVPIDGTVVCGDFNLPHTDIGTPYPPRGAKARNSNALRDSLTQNQFTLMNTGSPTRFSLNNNRLKHSWLDWSACSGILRTRFAWNTQQFDKQSDHYQIHMKFDGSFRCTEDDTQETAGWSIKDTPEKWSQFTERLEYEWSFHQPVINALRTENNQPRQTKINIIANLIKSCYHQAAQTTFGRKARRHIWRKWITRKQQSISINYHKFFRKFRRKRHKTAQDWKRLKDLRRQRNRLLRSHKTAYFNKKFSKEGLVSRSAWQASSEMRDINEIKGQHLPNMIDPHTGATLSTNNTECGTLFNNYQHRYNTAQLSHPSWCWPTASIIHPPDYYTLPPRSNLTLHKDHERAPPVQPQEEAFDTSNEEFIVDDYTSLNDTFTRWIVEHTQQKWIRAQPNHTYYLHLLNAPITKPEIRRALRGFNNYKAYGPDEIDIKFLKKSNETTINIMNNYLNIMFTEWQMIPDMIKSRWITPVIKQGRPANLLKNLRPVSLTSYIGKLFEKIMNYRIVTYMVRLQLLSPKHFAYLPGRSTKDCVSFLIDRILRNFNRKRLTHAIFFDLSSAFDTVQHDLLLWKLKHEYFITGPFLDTLRSFLHQRQSAVKICGIISAWQTDIRGCPQGGGLSAILYTIYFDNASAVDTIKRIQIIIFSDDVSIYNLDTTDTRSNNDVCDWSTLASPAFRAKAAWTFVVLA